MYDAGYGEGLFGTLLFRVPSGGYAEAPVSTTGSGAFDPDRHPLKIAIAGDSDLFGGANAAGVPLISYDNGNGIYTDALTTDAGPRASAVTFRWLYAGGSPVAADGERAKYLTFDYRRRGVAIFLR